MQRPNSAFTFKCLLVDPNGRVVIAKIKFGEEELFLTSVYAPCDSQQQLSFIQNLGINVVSKTDTSKSIITGDWNTTLQSIDKRGGGRGGRPSCETSCRNSLLNFMEELGFEDAFRALRPKMKVYI